MTLPHPGDGSERRQTESDTDRGAVEIVDIILGFGVLVALMATYPIWNKFINMVAGEADPFTAVLLRLVFPSLVLGFFISMGVSARRGS
mgnify:CR=1 FL=1